VRFHNNNSYAPDGDLPVRMNDSGGGEPFGIIDLGHSNLCLDGIEDAQRLFDAAAKVLGYYQMLGQEHAYARGSRSSHCVTCGQLKNAAEHATAASVAA
jgi:hypothetical protein